MTAPEAYNQAIQALNSVTEDKGGAFAIAATNTAIPFALLAIADELRALRSEHSKALTGDDGEP